MTTTPNEPTEGGEFPPDPGLEPAEPTEPGYDDRTDDDETDADPVDGDPTDGDS